MRDKMYFIAPNEALPEIRDRCVKSRREWHAHTLPPDHARSIVVVIEPPDSLAAEFAHEHVAFPDVNDHNETITLWHPWIAATAREGETTYKAMKRFAQTAPMMHPKG